MKNKCPSVKVSRFTGSNGVGHTVAACPTVSEDGLLAIEAPVADEDDIGLKEDPRDAYEVELHYY